MKDSNSNGVNDLLTHKTIPVTQCKNLLTSRDTGKKFELKGDLLKTITDKNYNVDLASLSYKNFLFDFAEERYFDLKATYNKNSRDRSPIKMLKSPAIMVLGIST